MTKFKSSFLLTAITAILYGWAWNQSLPVDALISDDFIIQPVPANDPAAAPVFHEQFICPPGNIMVHSASIAESANGRLFAVWYGGSHECAPDTKIFFAAGKPGDTVTWEKPRAIVNRESASVELDRYIKTLGNPVIACDGNGRLWLLFVTVSIGRWSGSSINVKLSEDDGQTWTDAKRLILSPFFNLSELVRNNPVPLEGGGFAVPIYHEFIGNMPELLRIRMSNDRPTVFKRRMAWSRQWIQPSIAANENHVVAFYRHRSKNTNVFMAQSNDSGRSWEEPKALDLPHPGSGLNAIALGNDRFVLAYNHSTTERDNLALTILDGRGKALSKPVYLENDPGKKFSYPCMIQGSKNRVHLVYSYNKNAIRHVEFNEAWLKGKMK